MTWRDKAAIGMVFREGMAEPLKEFREGMEERKLSPSMPGVLVEGEVVQHSGVR